RDLPRIYPLDIYRWAAPDRPRYCLSQLGRQLDPGWMIAKASGRPAVSQIPTGFLIDYLGAISCPRATHLSGHARAVWPPSRDRHPLSLRRDRLVFDW